MTDTLTLDRTEFQGAKISTPVAPEYFGDARLTLSAVVQVHFLPVNRIFLCNTGDLPLRVRDEVVVETDKGPRIGTIVTLPERTLGQHTPHFTVLRLASSDDRKHKGRRIFKEEEAFQFCLDKVRERRLEMKLVSVEYLHTGHKAIFYFSAEGRIDFRELVRDLAQRFRVRIEMRQIGIRDEAKIIGGIGPCGLQTCCSKHLQDFSPVTIRMAKNQNLVLNPQKVSGICGRLMCCLAYENDMYSELRRELPRVGRTISTPQGEGVVRAVQIIGKRVKVQLNSDEYVDFHVSELEQTGEPDVVPAEEERPRRSRRGVTRQMHADELDAPVEQPESSVDGGNDGAAPEATDDPGNENGVSRQRRRRSRSRGGRRRRPDASGGDASGGDASGGDTSSADKGDSGPKDTSE